MNTIWQSDLYGDLNDKGRSDTTSIGRVICLPAVDRYRIVFRYLLVSLPLRCLMASAELAIRSFEFNLAGNVRAIRLTTLQSAVLSSRGVDFTLAGIII